MTIQEILDNLGNLSQEDCQTLHFARTSAVGVYLGGWGVNDLTETYLMTEEQAVRMAQRQRDGSIRGVLQWWVGLHQATRSIILI